MTGSELCASGHGFAILGDLVADLEADRAVERDAADIIGVVADDGGFHSCRAHPPHALVHQRVGQPAPLEVAVTADWLEVAAAADRVQPDDDEGGEAPV